MWRYTLRYAPRYTGNADAMKDGAGTRSRTKDFHITNVALYQLSYTGVFLAAARSIALPAICG